MKDEKKMIEDRSSLQVYDHIFTCTEEERDNCITMIKGLYPGLDIEVTRTGYKVKVVRKKTDKESSEFAAKNKPKDTSYQELFTQDNKGKRGKK
jgi:hypothetical protein